jgi:hypothetical protein
LILLVFVIFRLGDNREPKHRADDKYSVDNTTPNLLEKYPVKLVWDAGFPRNNVALSDDNKLSVITKGAAVLLLQEKNHSAHFSIRARFEFEEPNGRVGLMWGYGLKQVAGSPGVKKAHAVRVTLSDQTYACEPVELTFHDSVETQLKITSPLGRLVKMNLESRTTIDMEVEVHNGRIERVTVQNKDLPIEQTKKPVFVEGGLGVYLQGDFVITEAWYLNKEKKNGKN